MNVLPPDTLTLPLLQVYGSMDKIDQIACLNKTRRHYRWPRMLFMKFLVWAVYNVYIIMDSYRPHSCAWHRFRTGNNLCVVSCAKYNKYLKKHPATSYGNMPHKLRKTTFWCSTCHMGEALGKGTHCRQTLPHTHNWPGNLEPPQISPRHG